MTIHLVEPGGSGGIYQHTVALAAALVQGGHRVEIHTADHPEELPGVPPLVTHRCLWRFRSVPVWPLRRLLLVAGWLAVGVPSCLLRIRRSDVVHVQGRFRPVLLALLFVGLRLRRPAVVAYSPHTSYSRTGSERDQALVRWMARQADVVFAFTEWDRRRMESWGANVVPASFAVLAPRPPEEAVCRWRKRWLAKSAGAVVLFAGQLRADKGLDQAVEAMAAAGAGWVLAVVGEDLGAGEAARRRAEELGVRAVWDVGYQPYAEFAAAVTAADVVVCPYRVASQSAVLALAAAVGRPTVVTDVGGLPEMATVVVPADDPAALADGIRRALEQGPQHPQLPDWRDVADEYLAAYGAAPAGASGVRRPPP